MNFGGGRLADGGTALEQRRGAPAGIKDLISLGEPRSIDDLRCIERSLNLHHAKWDTHVSDHSALSAEPVLIRREAWEWLCVQAEAAAQELFELEREIADDEALQKLIGVPRNLRRVLQTEDAASEIRTLRFDFHPTDSGWVISEVNSDVPGGFGESSCLPRLYQRRADEIRLPADPLKRWGDAIEPRFSGGTAALLCAPGFLEDEQVVRTLARELRKRGLRVHLIQSPFALRWSGGSAGLRRDPNTKIDLLVRFYQVEWLAELAGWTGWKKILRAQGHTVVTNPAIAAISESKRLGLCLDLLSARSEHLRRLMPECREPEEIAGMPKDDWVLKAAYSNTGDEVHLGSDMSAERWLKLIATARREPRRWVAQRRFETLSLPSLAGAVKPCIGVFVIGGLAAGAYVRLSRAQVTDGDALEAPLFLTKEDG